MLALALVGALPLASAADGEEPWFDYKTFAESFGPDDPLAFDWGHSYGPLDWPREGSEVLRVATTRPSYWKMRNLDEFDGEQWTRRAAAARRRATPRASSRPSGRCRPAGARRFA